MQHFASQTFELVLLAVVAMALLFQTVILIALFIAIRKAVTSTKEQIESIRSTVTPLIENSYTLLTRIGPRIEKTTEDLSAITHAVRLQTNHVQSASTEIIARVRAQAARLDTQVTELLDTLDRAGNYLSDTVARPMRQLSAILASVRAAVESFRNNDSVPRSQAAGNAGDNDMFV